jgi:hypothetical protein
MWGNLIGAGVGLLGGLLSGSKKKQEVQDPLAGIRAQLQGLAGQIPGMVARQKENIAKEYGALKDQGQKQIGEDVYATRGFGRTSIEDRLRNELYDKLARGQSADELNAEKWGLSEQARILGSLPATPVQEETTNPWWQTVGESLGQAFGQGGTDNLFGKKTSYGAPDSWEYNDIFSQIKNTPGTSYL